MKKSILKKVFASFLACATLIGATIGLTACNQGNSITISILQYAEHSSLDNCRSGINAGLAERGYDFTKVTYVYQNAKANNSDNTTFAKSIINNKPNVAVGIATPSAQALASAAKLANVPVVFTAVSDPEGAGFKDYDNATGSSDSLPLSSQLNLIKSFFPTKETVKIGIVYTATEDNSVSQVKSLKDMQNEYGVQIETVSINSGSEVATAVSTLISRGVDCLNNLTDNTVVQNLQTELDKANAANIPVFGSEIEQVEKGCLASCSLDYVDLGIKTGYMVADILEGKKPSEMEYVFIDEFETDYNSTVLTTLGLTLSSELTNAKDVTQK